MKGYTISAVIWKEGDQYVSKCPELNVASCGDTSQEALEMMKEAVDLYLENAKELGLLNEIHDAISSEKLTTTFHVAS